MIDDKPAVGRIYVGKAGSLSAFPYPDKDFYGEITRMSGHRVYFICADDKVERFTHAVGYICDSMDEVHDLFKLTEDSKERFRQAILKTGEELNALVAKYQKEVPPKVARRRKGPL